MRIRTLLRLLATGAGGWAVAVSGVKDNPQFAIFLAMVALLSFLAAENYGKVSKLRKVYGWKLDGPLALALVCLVFLGGFFAVHFYRPDAGTIDQAARDSAQAGKDDTGQLRTEVVERTSKLEGQISTLRAELKTAMEFQTNEKTAREAREFKEQAEKEEAARATAANRTRIRGAIRVAEAMRREWLLFQRKAANICTKEQIGSSEQEFSALSLKTRVAIATAGYPEYSPDIVDNSRCPNAGIPNQCITGGFNSEAVIYYGSAGCRISNIGIVIDKLRSREP